MSMPLSMSDFQQHAGPGLGLNAIAGIPIGSRSNPPRATLWQGLPQSPGQPLFINNMAPNETSYSSPEITAKASILMDGPCYQNEFFFAAYEDGSQPVKREHYVNTNMTPINTLSLHHMYAKAKNTRAAVGQPPDPKKVPNFDWFISCRPLGSFFAYTEKSNEKHLGIKSRLVAYACGGLNDILNTWHVPLYYGAKLWYVLLEVTDNKITASNKQKSFIQIVSYLGEQPKKSDFYSAQDVASGEFKDYEVTRMAILQVGMVVVPNNSYPPSQDRGPFLYNPEKKSVPVEKKLNVDILDVCEPDKQKYRGNYIRVMTSFYQWKEIY